MNPPTTSHFPSVAEDVSFTVPLTVQIEFIERVSLEPHILHEEEMDGGDEGDNGPATSIRYLLTSFSSSSEGGQSTEQTNTGAVATEAVFVPATWSGGDWHLCVSEHINVICPPPSATTPIMTRAAAAAKSMRSEHFPYGFLFTTTVDMETYPHRRHASHHFRHACRVAVDTRTVSAETMMTSNGLSMKTRFQLSTLQVPPEASVLLVGDVVPSHLPNAPPSTTRHRGRPLSIMPPSLNTNLRPESWMLPLSLRQQLVLLKLSAVHSDWLFPNTTLADEEELDHINDCHNGDGGCRPYYLSRKPLASVPILTPPSIPLHALVERYQEGLYKEDDAAMVIFNPALLSGVNITTTGRFGPRDAIITAAEKEINQPVSIIKSEVHQQHPRSTNSNDNGDDAMSIAYHRCVLGNIAAVADAFGAFITTKLQIGRTDVVIAARADPSTTLSPPLAPNQRCATPSKKSSRGNMTSAPPPPLQQPYHEFTTTSKMAALRALVISNSKVVNTRSKTRSIYSNDVSNVSPLPQVESVLWLQQCIRDLLVFGPSSTTATLNDDDRSSPASPKSVPSRVVFAESLKARWTRNPSRPHRMNVDNEDGGPSPPTALDLAGLSIPYSVRILLEGNLWSSLHDQKVDEEIRSLNIVAGDTPMRPLAPGSVMATPGCSTPGSNTYLFPSPMSASVPSPHHRAAISADDMCANKTPSAVAPTKSTTTPSVRSGESLNNNIGHHNDKGGMSPKVSTFTVNAGLLQSLLTSYYKTNKKNSIGGRRASTASASISKKSAEGNPSSEVVVQRSDELVMRPTHLHDPTTSDMLDTVTPMTFKQPSTLPAVRPPAGAATTEDVDFQGLVERQLFDKDGKETSCSPSATSSPNYLTEVPHTGEESNSASNASSSGSSIFANPSKPRCAHKVAKDRRNSLLTQSTQRMLSTMCRSLSLSRGRGDTASSRRTRASNLATCSKRPREGDCTGEEDDRSRLSAHTHISIGSPTDNDASRSTPPGGGSGLQSPQRAEVEEYEDASNSCSILSPTCRFPLHLDCPQHNNQQQPTTVIKRRVYVGEACMSTGEGDSLRVDNHHHSAVLGINHEDHHGSTLNPSTNKSVATIGVDANMGDKSLNALYFASPARSIKLTLLQ